MYVWRSGNGSELVIILRAGSNLVTVSFDLIAASSYSITFIFIIIKNTHFYLLNRYKSRTTIAAMLSTTGTALLTTQGSWRPWASKIISSPLKLDVSYSRPIVETGLNATLK